MEYIYDEEQRPPSMSKRKAQSAAFLQKNPDYAPILTSKKNLATSAIGKHWCWLVHQFVESPHLLEEGRRIVRAGEIVDHADLGKSFRVTVLSPDKQIYTVEMQCEASSAKKKKMIIDNLRKNTRELRMLLMGKLSTSIEWVVAKQSEILPNETSLEMQCNCIDYAPMCAHKVGALYAYGVYLDSHPLSLFELQDLSRTEMMESLPASHGAQSFDAAKIERDFSIELFSIEE